MELKNQSDGSLFHTVIYPTPQVCTGRVLGAAATNEMVFCNTKTVSRLLCYRNFQSSENRFTKDRKSSYHSKTNKKNYMRGGIWLFIEKRKSKKLAKSEQIATVQE